MAATTADALGPQDAFRRLDGLGTLGATHDDIRHAITTTWSSSWVSPECAAFGCCTVTDIGGLHFV